MYLIMMEFLRGVIHFAGTPRASTAVVDETPLPPREWFYEAIMRRQKAIESYAEGPRKGAVRRFVTILHTAQLVALHTAFVAFRSGA